MRVFRFTEIGHQGHAFLTQKEIFDLISADE
jgi:hypothetical protein